MQFPESWLREFCNPPISTQQLADLLTMAGLEVEEMSPVAPPFTNIVVAEIVEAEQHPNADRLRVCRWMPARTADAAADRLRRAQRPRGHPRALRPGGRRAAPGEDGKPFQIKVGKLRGVESFGMLCSARELQLSEDHGGLLELPADAPLGQDIRQYLNLDDTLFTLKLTPNLAHCLSVYGVAREVSALTGTPLNAPPRRRGPALDDSCRWTCRPATCAAASRAASCAASTRRPRRRPGWSSAWRAAASARSARWWTSPTT
jgi:phenylalanyl-tRNA synthetase beta chain